MKNWFNESDYEKIVTGTMFMLVTISVVIKYMTKNNTDPNMIYFALGIGGLFITRKAVSYFKPNQYYANVYGENTTNINENVQEIVNQLPNQVPNQQNNINNTTNQNIR